MAPDDSALSGTSWQAALAVLLLIALVGAVVDKVAGLSSQLGFNAGFVLASVVAISIVKPTRMFPIVVSPPIIYTVATAVQIYVRSGRLSNRNTAVDDAGNFLNYGFPAIVVALALVGAIALVRYRRRLEADRSLI